MSTKSRAPRVRSWYTEVFIACRRRRWRCVLFVSVQELELRKIPFDLDFPAGEMDFGGLRQIGSLHAEGQAELTEQHARRDSNPREG